MNCEIEPGDICVIPFPFSSSGKERKRPALALTKPDRYGDIQFAFITAKEKKENSVIKLEKKDYSVGCEPLPRVGYLHLEKQFLLNKEIVIKKKTRLNEQIMQDILRKNIIKEIAPFCKEKYKPSKFIPGETSIPVSGKVIGEDELRLLVEASLDGWLTTGRFNREFEKRLSSFVGVKHVITTNSGSSANLLAIAALTSPKLGERAVTKGDEVITVAAGFPTTVNPILQYGLVPVFVDIDIPTYNVDVSQIEAAISEKTKVIMLAHTLGNTFNINEVMRIARKYNLWVIEDCCDALGTTYLPVIESSKSDSITNRPIHVGTFGDIATLSFYPAHHITMGEGGAVFTNNGKLKTIIESFRDWGRDCFCEPGKDNTCKKRFSYQLGELPCGYDHKYTYSHVGFNLKITDMQAAVALAQMDKLPSFIKDRQENFSLLFQGLKSLSQHLILPEATEYSSPSWFGFPITLIQHQRHELIAFLEQKKIASRLLFGGNLTRQPYFKHQKYRVASPLQKTDLVMDNSLWLGVYPGLNKEMLEYVIKSLEDFFV